MTFDKDYFSLNYPISPTDVRSLFARINVFCHDYKIEISDDTKWSLVNVSINSSVTKITDVYHELDIILKLMTFN